MSAPILVVDDDMRSMIMQVLIRAGYDGASPSDSARTYR